MKKIILFLGILALSITCSFGQDQDTWSPEEVCLEQDDSTGYNFFDNPFFGTMDPTSLVFVAEGDYPCFQIIETGQLFLIPQEELDCCGDHVVLFMVEDLAGGQLLGPFEQIVTIKCDVKPDCALFNMADFIVEDPLNGEEPNEIPDCITVCEFSETTFFHTWDPTSSYNWIINGEQGSGPLSNPAEFFIFWDTAGTGTVILEIIDANGLITTIEICVEILEGPEPMFEVDCDVCLEQDMTFLNTSINADDYYWDFGDGTFSSDFSPTKHYDFPGSYIVTLVATKYNYDANGNPSCCCTQSYQKEINVSDLPGPNIYWVSTLCEGDETKYWTDAVDCNPYIWTVRDEFGVIVPHIPVPTNDTICVTWNSGNFGTVTLEAVDCLDEYCPNPTTVIVPIIPVVADIDGPIVVCEFSTHTYSLPKWINTQYDWNVPGATILSGQGTHQISVMWGAAGFQSIDVHYFSQFLADLPEHEFPDCHGDASLGVEVRPEFSLVNTVPSSVCEFQSTTFILSNTPFPNYTWTVNPPATFVVQGPNQITVTWDGGPGYFEVIAVPDDPNAYCNNEFSKIINVIQLPPPLGIDGEIEICPGETYYYDAIGSVPGVDFTWSISGGALSSPTGNTVSVVWDNSGSHQLFLSQTMQSSPFCSSDLFMLNVDAKTIDLTSVILGNGNCSSEIITYNLDPIQHADAVYTWSLTDPSAGTVVDGQGTDQIDIQWNNWGGSVDILCQVDLCGDTHVFNLNQIINIPIEPVITQTGYICTGVTATLDIPSGWSNQVWSNGPTFTNSSTINSSGIYSVMVEDINGCESTVYYEATAIADPVASLSSPNDLLVCVNTAPGITIYAETDPDYSFVWTCTAPGGGTSTPSTPDPSILVISAPYTTPGTYSYTVVVTHDPTGCTSLSDPIEVDVSSCTGGSGPGNPLGCTPDPNHTIDPVVVLNTPNCNQANFGVTNVSNASFDEWDLGDGTLSNSSALTHTYTNAGCYNTKMWYYTPNSTGTGSCHLYKSAGICIPLAANFEFAFVDCFEVCFTDLSTYIENTPGNEIDTWTWDFDGWGTSTATDPCFSFPGAGTYNVTLTVESANNNCIAVITIPVVMNTIGVPSISATPNPTWVGTPVDFVGTAVNAVKYTWDFGDGDVVVGANASHTYANAVPHLVTLTVEDNRGCENSITVLIDVLPELNLGPIVVSDDVICDNEFANLSVPSGYTYLWSNGATSDNINVNIEGEYSVVITDGFGCQQELGPVYITVIPSPVVNISGDLYICDDGCTELSGPGGSSYLYEWRDNSSVISTASTVTICTPFINNPYILTVTDPVNLCVGQAMANVQVVITTPIAINNSNSPPCAGAPNNLSVSPFDPSNNYVWSTGELGPNITVTAAGTYTVSCIDPISGCVVSASTIVNPQPEYCLLPEGCYTVCDTTVVCAEPGLLNYDWFYNGSPYAPVVGMDNCILLDMSGTYTLTGTNSFGCSSDSGELIVEVINCDSVNCDDLQIDYQFLQDSDGNTDFCCVGLTYSSSYPDIFRMNINTGDADFLIGAVDPLFQTSNVTANSFDVLNTTPFTPLPTGTYFNYVEFCLNNVVNNPQTIYIDWYDMDNNLVCTDSISMECPSISCDDLAIDYQFLVNDDGSENLCCAELTYINNYGLIQGMTIHSSDATLSFSSIDPILSVQSLTTNSIGLSHTTPGVEIPTGVLNDFIIVCVDEAFNSPQLIIIDWYDFANDIVCSDSLYLECPVEPPCPFITEQSIYCEDGQTVYEFTVCNPVLNPYNVGYLDFNVINPPGIVLTPSSITIGSPINPGDCQSFSINLSGSNIAFEEFCFELLVHEFDPIVDPSTWCCSLDTLYCIEIPPCDPCGDVGIEGVVDNDYEDCCYQVQLYNDYAPDYFDGINLCVITPNTNMSINNPFGSGWFASNTTSTSVDLIPVAPMGTYLPFNIIELPEICIDTEVGPTQQVVVKWMREGEVVCTDTLTFNCDPACGYLVDEYIECNPDDGTWLYSGELFNTSGFAVSAVQVIFDDPALSAYNSLTTIPTILNGQSFSPYNLVIGSPAQPGDEICFTVTLHETTSDGLFLSCCNFHHCIILPDCGFQSECLCEDEFYANVDLGFQAFPVFGDPFTFNFYMTNLNYFSECDVIDWRFGDGEGITLPGNVQVEHTYAVGGQYQVCIRVTRYDDNGVECAWKYCAYIQVGAPSPPEFSIYPNPTDGPFTLKLSKMTASTCLVTISNINSKELMKTDVEVEFNNQNVEIDLSGYAKGMYIVTIQYADEVVTKRISKL